jgi:hypothetical protein
MIDENQDNPKDMLASYVKPEYTLGLLDDFELAKFKNLAKNLSREQAIDLAIEAYRTMLINRMISTELVGHSWGMNNDA